MATKVRRRARARLLLGRLWASARPRRETTVVGLGAVWPDDPDDGSAGVREPRRPRPDLPTLTAEGAEPD